jgi:hypothetical protein
MKKHGDAGRRERGIDDALASRSNCRLLQKTRNVGMIILAMRQPQSPTARGNFGVARSAAK